ncbi:MAG: oligopeptide ABC transporter substrate-binding protein OppA [Moraxellaceae bacterium]|nr:oligopeptide ABC transporter substrate-binding protein OppA [Moraxellaceae bacterium]
MAVALTACAKPAEQADSKEKQAEKVETTTEKASTGGLAEKQEITMNNGTEPTSLDPHKVSGVPESNVIRQFLEGLTTTDVDGNTIPGIAESWESPDNKVWTFKLRDAKWSNGDPVTAGDFVYSLRRLADPNTASPYSSYIVDAKIANAQQIIDGKAKVDTLGVKAVDDKTLEITLSEPVPYLPDVMIHTAVKPVHQKTVEKFGDKWTDPKNIVVNGAYIPVEWKPNDKIVMERNPEYYNNAQTTINKVTFLPITSETTAVDNYKSGSIDYGEFPPEQYQKLKKELGDEVNVAPKLCTYYYEYNTQKAPFDNTNVRRALALALDRDIIVDKVMNSMGQQAAYQFTPPSTQGGIKNTPEWEGWDKEKRIAEAKKLLAEAGYNEENPLKFELLYNTNESHKKIAVAASQLWKKALGEKLINVTLVNQEWKTYLDTREQGNYQISRAGWCGDYNEASTFLNILQSKNGQNHGKYSSQAYDDLMASTLKTGVDSKQRTEIYNKAEAQLDKDMPLLNVYFYVSGNLIKPYVQGFGKTDPLSNWQVKDMKIAKH